MSYSNVLIVIDTPSIDYEAFFNELLPYCNSKNLCITLFNTLKGEASQLGDMLDSTEKQSLRSSSTTTQKSFLDSIQIGLSKKYPNITFNCDVSWRSNPISDILEHIAVYKNDLVVKAYTGATPNYLLSPNLSAHLIRRCPANILFVKSSISFKQSVLVALNTLEPEDSQNTINRSLVNLSSLLANELQAELHVVSAYSTSSTAVAIELPEYNPTDYNSKLEAQCIDNLRDIPSIYSIIPQNIHIEQGLTSDVIIKQSEKLPASLLVLGSNGRIGISALLLGNTAEYVIDKVNCNVLISRTF